MGWVLLAVAMLIALVEMARHVGRGMRAQALGIDFASSPEHVEMTLRALAHYAEQGSVYDLTVYFATEDAEARTIALRLGQYLPLRLLPDTLPSTGYIEANDLSPQGIRQEVQSKFAAHSGL